MHLQAEGWHSIFCKWWCSFNAIIPSNYLPLLHILQLHLIDVPTLTLLSKGSASAPSHALCSQILVQFIQILYIQKTCGCFR
jgi:hypothetical protein